MNHQRSTDSGTLAIALRRINHALDRHSREQNTLSGLTVPQALVLAGIAQCEEPPAVTRLSESLAMSQATTTDITLRLATKGLIARSRDPEDGRRTVLSVTPAGWAALASASELLPSRFLERFAALSEARRARLVRGVLDLAALMADPEHSDSG